MVREEGKNSHLWGLRFDEKNAASFAGNACLSPVGGGASIHSGWRVLLDRLV